MTYRIDEDDAINDVMRMLIENKPYFSEGIRGESSPKLTSGVRLGSGMFLIPLRDTAFDNSSLMYSNLYRDNVKVCDRAFRMGGFSTGFKDGYMSVLYYPNFNAKDGSHMMCNQKSSRVIIDMTGKVVMASENALDSIIHIGGEVAAISSGSYTKYYCISSNKLIVCGSNSVRSSSYIFVENRFNSKFDIGVYKIEIATGNYEVFK